MDGFIFIILLLLTYVVVELKFLFIPALKRLAGYSTKELRGKFCQTEFFIPPRMTESPLQLSYEVSQAGLTSTLEIETLAEFDSLGKKLFMLGKLRLIRNEFFRSTNFGPHGVIAKFINRQDFLADCEIDCSPESFDLVMAHLKNNKSILIRIAGHHIGKSGEVAANRYNILTSFSGAPEYFCERYTKYYSEAGDDERKNLMFFDQKFNRIVRSTN